MANMRIGNPEIQATLLTKAALEPGKYAQVDLSKLLGEGLRADISRTAVWYEQAGWLHVDSSVVAGARKLYSVTPEFWDDFKDAVKGIELPHNDAVLFTSAIELRRTMEKLPARSMDHDKAHANFLGRAALLSERYDLSRGQGWIAGMPGWRSLMTIEALRSRA